MRGAYWLIYPRSRQGYSYWLRCYERRYRGMYSEVTPYTNMNRFSRLIRVTLGEPISFFFMFQTLLAVARETFKFNDRDFSAVPFG